jgi:hypothetical protein
VKISVKLTKELAQKLDGWKSFGFRPSDSVRLALSLLPGSPDEMRNESGSAPLRLRPLRSQCPQVELKDEKEALRNLQEW